MVQLEKHLKSELYYRDLYDRHTVERCRDIITFHSRPVKNPPLIDGKEPTKEIMDAMSKWAIDFGLMFEKGERYTHKEETVRKWMAADKAKDDLYESAMPPVDVSCLTCHARMVLLDKDLWTAGLNEPDRVLFMFDCPNGCLPRRAFFNNGEEWRIKPNPCPKCGAHLKPEHKTTEDKFITIYKCESCDFTKTEELERMANKKEKPDPNFEDDKNRFCLSKDEGDKWPAELANIEEMGKLVAEWKERDKNKEVYDKVAELKKLTVVELEKLIVPVLEKANYIHLQLGSPEIGKDVIIPFMVQDSKSGRENLASQYDLKQLLKKILKDTNWRIMSDGVSCRLGILNGRLRGYENEKDMLKLVIK